MMSFEFGTAELDGKMGLFESGSSPIDGTRLCQSDVAWKQ